MAKPIRRAILAAAAGLALSVGAIASMPVPHRSGGVSVEDFAEMRQQASAYSLELVLAARGSGAYLADVDVTVRSLPSRSVVLEHRTQGPLLLAALPPGHYELTASFSDVLPGAATTLTRVVNVPRRGLVRTVVYFDTGDEVGSESAAAVRLN
ncbi:MAG: hypothetical protein Q8N44_08145 [Rubrivivax sp.]|nr:hypothetical protein [Rubrivivax sp.]